MDLVVENEEQSWKGFCEAQNWKK